MCRPFQPIEQMLKGLSSEEKLQWALEAKDNAKKAFKEQRFEVAMNIYVESLAAAEFGSNNSESIDLLVVPVVCNLGLSAKM